MPLSEIFVVPTVSSDNSVLFDTSHIKIYLILPSVELWTHRYIFITKTSDFIRGDEVYSTSFVNVVFPLLFQILILKVIGKKVAPLRKVVRGSVEWAKLEDAGHCQIAAFIDTLDEESGEDRWCD